MVRTADKDLRRKQVLTGTIEAYINDALPVSSERLQQAAQFDLSCATLRNILSELEEEGYLTHPHTSAGRIPTDKGYRYYVDFLVGKVNLLEGEKRIIQEQYKKAVKEIEFLLEDTSEMLSFLTHCTGIVSFSDWEDRLFWGGASCILEQPEFKNPVSALQVIRFLEERKRLLQIINQDLEKKLKIYIGEELACHEMNDCSLVISTYEIKHRPSGRIAVLGPKRMHYSKVVSVLEYLSEQLSEFLSEFEL